MRTQNEKSQEEKQRTAFDIVSSGIIFVSTLYIILMLAEVYLIAP